MITRHFKAALAIMAEAISTAASYYIGRVPIRDVKGRPMYLTGGMVWLNQPTDAVTLQKNDAGISIGTGTAAATEDDFNLEAPVTSGATLTLTSVTSGCDTCGNPYKEFVITVTNTGSATLAVGEVCYKQTAKGTYGCGDGSSGNMVFMIDRTVLSAPMEIAAGDAGVLTYRLATNYFPAGTVGGVLMASWAWGTDEEVAALIDAARLGTVDLQRDAGWKVGDVRRIRVGAFTGGGNKSYAEQDVFIVITQFGAYNGCDCLFQFDFISGMNDGARMNSTSTNSGGYADSEMYRTTLPALAAALPTWLKDRLMTFSVLTSAGSQSSTIVSTDNNKLALRSATEVFDDPGNAFPGEGTRVAYYATNETRMKPQVYNSTTWKLWWLRSPRKDNGTSFCVVQDTGNQSTNAASANTTYFMPFGCL